METATASKKKSPPPFPKEKHWLFGSGYALREKAHEVMPEMIKKYGEIFSLSLPFTRLAIAASPEYAKYVLVDNNKNYQKSLAYDMSNSCSAMVCSPAKANFGRSKLRILAQPAFHKQKLADLTAMMVRKAQQETDSLQAKAESGEYFDVAPQMTNLTLEIISEAIFSNGVDDKADLISQQITLLNQYATDKLNSPIRLPALFPTPSNVKERKAIKILDQIIFDIIDKRRKEGVSKSDLLSMSLDARDQDTGEAMDNRQLRDEVMTIFIAGN